MYTQQRAPASLLATDKPVSQGTNRRDFFFFLHAHLQHGSGTTTCILSEPPGLSEGLLPPNDHSPDEPGAAPQGAGSNLRDLPKLACLVTTRLLCCMWIILRSRSLAGLQPGDTASRGALCWDRHDNRNAADGGIISSCLLAHSASPTCYAFRCSYCGAARIYRT